MEVKGKSVRKILAYRDWAELAGEAEYNAGTLAVLCQANRRTLERLFRAELQTTPQRWLNALRDFEAVRLIKLRTRKKEIVQRLGYKHQAHLSRRLRKVGESAQAIGRDRFPVLDGEVIHNSVAQG